MSRTPAPKRFIAGATCPQCGELDSVRMWRAIEGATSVERRDCVACGWQDRLSEEPELIPIKTDA